MKAVILLFLFYLYGVQSDVYYITFVKGQVELESNKKNIKVGDKITGNDKLVFKDQNSKVSCISPSRGRFDITPGASNPRVKGEWIAIIKSNLIPSSSQQRLSSRSLGSDSGYDPVSYFAGDKSIVLLDGIPLSVSASYKLNTQNFFFVQYELEGKNIVRRIPNQNQTLIFSAGLFTDNDGKPIRPEFVKKSELVLPVIEDSGPRSKVLVAFNPVLVDKNELSREINVLYTYLKALKKDNIKEIKNEIFAHLSANYGIVNSDEIEKQFFAN